MEFYCENISPTWAKISINYSRRTWHVVQGWQVLKRNITRRKKSALKFFYHKRWVLKAEREVIIMTISGTGGRSGEKSSYAVYFCVIMLYRAIFIMENVKCQDFFGILDILNQGLETWWCSAQTNMCRAYFRMEADHIGEGVRGKVSQIIGYKVVMGSN